MVRDDCGVCVLIAQRLFLAFLCIHLFSVLLLFSDAIAGLGNVIPIWVYPKEYFFLLTHNSSNDFQYYVSVCGAT